MPVADQGNYWRPKTGTIPAPWVLEQRRLLVCRVNGCQQDINLFWIRKRRKQLKMTAIVDDASFNDIYKLYVFDRNLWFLFFR